MTPPLRHQHLIVRAEVAEPPRAHEAAAVERWMAALVDAIGMRTMFGPHAEYCRVPGNRGMTGFAIIETSHICVHTWDENEPAVAQLDVYTCSELPLDVVFAALRGWAPTRIDYKFLDREHGLVLVDETHPGARVAGPLAL